MDFVPQSQHPSHITPNNMYHPQLPNIIPNAALLRTHLIRRMIRDLIIVPQNRSFQASLSGHPPRRHKLLLWWTASQAFQSLPLVKVLRVYKIQRKTASNNKTESKSFCQNRMYKNVQFNRKPIFFLCFEPRRSRLKRVLCLCKNLVTP